VGEALRRQSRAAIPVIVLGEFRYGIAQSRHRSDYEAWLDSQLPRFEILVVTDETAHSYAALALQHGLPVLSRDQHFDWVPDLQRASW
jgi:tRNA(fMet)-specific endonuclease VapC